MNYDDPQPPRDHYTRCLYQEYGLSETSTMAEIEPIATRLLSDISTNFAGAELALGRRIDASEKAIVRLFVPWNGTPQERFALLLLQKSMEVNQ